MQGMQDNNAGIEINQADVRKDYLAAAFRSNLLKGFRGKDSGGTQK